MNHRRSVAEQCQRERLTVVPQRSSRSAQPLDITAPQLLVDRLPGGEVVAEVVASLAASASAPPAMIRNTAEPPEFSERDIGFEPTTFSLGS